MSSFVGKPSHYTVIVVGAGPAGSAASYHLAARGHSVLMLDRDEFPRKKLCGDCLTPRAVRVLEDMGVASAVASRGFRIQGCRIYSSRAGMAQTRFPSVGRYPDHGVVIDRSVLDDILKEHAVAAGAEFQPRTLVLDAITENGKVVGVRCRRDGREYEERARIVVAADGAHSRLARGVFGLKSRHARALGVAFRAYYDNVADFGDWMEIYGEDTVLPGVGWVFPLGDGRVNAGVGIYMSDFRQRGSSLEGIMRGFRNLSPHVGRRLAGARQVGRVQGAKLLMGGYRSTLVRPGIVLVGDAAGLVNPLTGEGMMYALESGAMAAKTIDATLSAGNGNGNGNGHGDGNGHSMVAYERYIKRELGRYFSLGTRFIHLAKRPGAVNTGLSVLTKSDRLAELNLRFWVGQF